MDRKGDPDKTSLDDQTTPGFGVGFPNENESSFHFSFFFLLFVSKTSRWPKSINFLHTFIFLFALIRCHISEIMLQLKEITLGTGGGIR